ncbi:lysosomal-associated transmembrane protein 4B [Lutzomyia longipalpis]|uniref:Putative lysosomal-associated transmembrane protein n=1 Tax=Lutzomyia longipalpis TaxID=7200 RepID=A0A1B0GIU6_LUTLO|nr:lysosomal-associated transmembrane protein 4B [Lutzomyia longipalpis]
MLRIRIKMGPSRNKEWSCCFGLHVRTATIIIGVWHLCLNLLALAVLAAIMRNPVMMQELENGYEDVTAVDNDAPALPTPLSKIDPPYAFRDHSLTYQNVDMGSFVCICMVAITLMMIFGAIKGKPSHLLPFLCLQLFDFAITILTAAGYLCYLRSVHRLIAESHRFPWREELLKLTPQTLSIVVLLAFIGVVLMKAYAIGIVWRCYKYLTMRQHDLRSMLPYIIPDVSHRQERDYSSLLPDYDEAISQSMKQAPPPSYQVAMATSIPTSHITTDDANITPDAGAVSSVTATISEIPPPPPYVSPSVTSAEVNVSGNEAQDDFNDVSQDNNARTQGSNK